MDGRSDRRGVKNTRLQAIDASPPFDKPSADLILRSSDLVDFRVHTCILKHVSSVFNDMFLFPQPNSRADRRRSGSFSDSGAGAQPYKNGLPLVPVQEASDVLGQLLRICYPVPNPSLDKFDTLSPVLAAAVKYAMDDILPVLQEDLRRFARSSPIRSYCLAVHYGFASEAQVAAQACLAFPMSTLHASDVPELRYIDARALLKLLRYHERCSEHVLALWSKLPWQMADWVWFTCNSSGGYCPSAPKEVYLAKGKRCVPTLWWYEYMCTIFDGLRCTPCGASIRMNTRALDKAIKAALKCPACGKFAQQQMRKFTEELEVIVDNRVSTVELTA